MCHSKVGYIDSAIPSKTVLGKNHKWENIISQIDSTNYFINHPVLDFMPDVTSSIKSAEMKYACFKLDFINKKSTGFS